MKPTLNDDTPIFLQIADMIKDDLVEGLLSEGEQIPSTTELSNFYNINRATAQKGITLLMDEGIVTKRRGIGVFIAEDARDKLVNTRMQDFSNTYIQNMVKEAKRLNINKEELIRRVAQDYDNH
ncbi:MULTISPECIES: GntR family transcriptional regulator [Mammaliicoccus]|uniref:GntR family transcriptional regulator n=1 Tax=Mammaliicoccus fleurettii TaxID=150056 RepID=A0ABS5MR10_9STAP|nr:MULTISPECIES: GntR family transcriptional regulator [Mammaliicoccus]MBL0848277.1 GntR family transcriptional regulator [Mammaliicoccus fleurettii]MBO3063454.1 GntR family transcriptional regulator [Mammaliicoccus fleurettii]MBS3672999.1 GntR family transcriptional regulator [Mammaliicoccus fleurettii]MBS3698087.1 GntR family transcriptional regulator [Mammaliicoccus fleurettii]MBW0765895.1 GntR family transcriptional regulator [Mammaliicoccus fleurettii]